MTRELPQFLRDLLASPPQAGEGVHNWLFRVARQLHAHLPAIEIVNLLESSVRGCGRQVSRSEIEDAVKNSLGCAWQPKNGGELQQSRPKWPKTNLELREAVVRNGVGLADLWECSMPRIEDNESHTEQILDWLFPGNPLLCAGQSQQLFDTKPREDWREKMAKLQFIVPSPMSAIVGKTKQGRESKHTLANTGPRRFLVCEFDSGSVDDQAALLWHLGTFAPLVLAVHSGGKSLHGWFFVQGQPDDKVEKFFGYAVSLGADPATWTRSQFVRMPDGQRDIGRYQTVFFLNLKPLETQK